MLSDTGGLLGIFFAFATFLSAFWNYHSFDNFMASRLFKIKKPAADIEAGAEFFNQSEYI